MSEKRENPKPKFEKTILYAYRGSVAHGMYVPNTDPNSIDDIDMMGIVVPEPRYYLGLSEWGSRGTKEVFEGNLDEVYYEARKFVHLLYKGNPNVISMLWLEPEDYVILEDVVKPLFKHRKSFMSYHMYDAFMGYAKAQEHKMTHQAYQGYMGEKRKRLVEKFGYDTKNAAHCIRLLRMLHEYLTEGKFIVKRQDNGELLDIKHGKWSFRGVTSTIKELIRQIDSIGNILPKPNFKKADRLATQIVKDTLEWYETV